jgi:hypothetical protein
VSKQKPSTANLYFEEAKYIVTRNLFAILSVILLVLGIINFIQGDINMIPTLAGGSVSALVLLILYQTKKYQIAAIVAVMLSTLAHNL